MYHVLLGLGIGLATILPPGPVTMTLLQLGTRHGRPAALRGAIGIATGDLAVVAVALTIIGAGSTLPAAAFVATQILAAAMLIGLGLGMLARPETCAAIVDRIDRPGRAFFLITSLTPTVLGAWIALLAAMPFAHDLAALARFAVGALGASFLWHPVLATISGRLGDYGPTIQRRLSRAGGWTMVTMGLAAVATNL